MKPPPQPNPSPGGPLRLIRAAVMPLTFTPRVVRNVSESNLAVHRHSTGIGNQEPLVPGPARTARPRHPGP